MPESEMNPPDAATLQRYVPSPPSTVLAELRQALDAGMGGMDDTAAWWYERVQVLVSEFDRLWFAASKAERYLAGLPDDPEPGDPRVVNIWYALRKAVRPYEHG